MLAAARSLPRLLILSEFERCRELLALFGRRFLFSGFARSDRVFCGQRAPQLPFNGSHRFVCLLLTRLGAYSAVIRVDWRSLCAFAFKRPSLFFSD